MQWDFKNKMLNKDKMKNVGNFYIAHFCSNSVGVNFRYINSYYFSTFNHL